MNDATLQRARQGDEEAFRAIAEPHRREMQVHCYRILGSVQDAEDAVQESFLAAWRGIGDFEGRSSLRSWLYAIATNRCLNSLRAKGRRPKVEGLTDMPEPTRRSEPIWLEPYPDQLIEGLPDLADGPDVRFETKEAVGLAFVSGLQRMPPAQRAVLVLRDVLGFSAAEVAEILGTTSASVTSALQRARGALDALPEGPPGGRLPESPDQRTLLTRFSDAFERGDVDDVVALLADDAWIRMPPEPHEYQGHDAIAEFLRTRIASRDGAGVHLVPTRANGQPAFAFYMEDPQAGVARAGGIFVITLGDGAITEVTRFGGNGVLTYFGLPRTLRL